MTQYVAQSACPTLEVAVTLGAAVRQTNGNMGRVYHAKGVDRPVRNSPWTGERVSGLSLLTTSMRFTGEIDAKGRYLSVADVWMGGEAVGEKDDRSALQPRQY